MLMKERQSREKTSGHVTDVKIWILNPDSCRHFHFYAPLVKTAIDILVESFIRFVDTLLQSWNSFSFILRITYAILFSFQILLSIWKLFLTYHISKGLKYSLTHFDWLKKAQLKHYYFISEIHDVFYILTEKSTTNYLICCLYSHKNI